MGNAAEWADLAALAILAPILGRLFFGGGDEGGAAGTVFAALAGGFLLRFVGAMLYGHVADRSPLKGPLLLSAAAIAAVSLCFALLPAAAALGSMAGLLFVGLRLLLGLVTAAEQALYANVRAALPHGTPPPPLAMLADAAPAAGILAVLGLAVLSGATGPEAEASGLWRVLLFVAPVLATGALVLRCLLPRTVWKAEGSLPARPALSALTSHLPDTLRVGVIMAPLAARPALIALIGLAVLELGPGSGGRSLSEVLTLAVIWLASAMLCAMGLSAIASTRGLTATLRTVLLLAAGLALATLACLVLDLPAAVLFGIALLPALAATDPLLPWRACVAAPDRTLVSSLAIGQALVFVPAGLLLPFLAHPGALSREVSEALAGGIVVLLLLTLAAIRRRR
ncbi:hypothetical protein ACFOGJ_07480 [Marinibaculum pumilum]|uniref:MFS transporter n=1 Tax=Marinibaculum pumilum TaxID=1766165 RepID=A0ABV7KXS0_9PROT